MGVDCLADCGTNYARLWLTAAVLGYAAFAVARRNRRAIIPALLVIAGAVYVVTARDHYGWTAWVAGGSAAAIALAGLGRVEPGALLAVSLAGLAVAVMLLAIVVRWHPVDAVPAWLLWLQAPGVVAEIERSTPYAQLPGWSLMVVGPNGLVYSALGALAATALARRAARPPAMGAPFAS